MATIKDVAKLAGVGVGTASRVISGRGAVSADAQARVQQAVASLEFRPSSIARALSLRTLGMIGVYVPHFGSTFYGPVLQAVDEELRRVDKHMVAANGCGRGNIRQQALDGVNFLIQKECDGILVLSNDLLDSDLVDLQRRFPKMVVVNRCVPGLAGRSFSTDHELGGRLVARALLARGHREIAVISGPHQAPDNEARMHGFYDELAQHQVRVPVDRVADGNFTFASGHAAMESLLAAGRPAFTALFAANDVMAMAAINRLQAQGLQVPREVSLIGFDDADLASYTTPRLTTVRIPIEATAVHAAGYLINECYGGEFAVQRNFPPELVWRESVGLGPYPPLALDLLAPAS